jgi:hypothetical protein
VRALAILNLPGVPIDLDGVLGYLGAARRAVTNGVAGYHLVVAEK